MSQQQARYERTIAAYTIRTTKVAAQMICDFLVGCINYRKYPSVNQIAEELNVLRDDVIDYLLTIHAVDADKGGYIRLGTGDMEVVLHPSYIVGVIEDIGTPALGMLGMIPLTLETPIELIIGIDPNVPLDRGGVISVLDKVNQCKALHVRLENAIHAKPVDEQQTKEQPAEVLQLHKILDTLKLPTERLDKNAHDLTNCIRLWQAEDAFVACTITFIENGVKIRLTSGQQNEGQPPDVDQIIFHLKKNDIHNYGLGVLLVSPFTPRDRWKEDRQVYRDFYIGDVAREKVDQAAHLLLG